VTREQRRKAHEAINNLGNYTVAKIVRGQFPDAKPSEINALAKKVVAAAHEQVSPKKKKNSDD
jgi:hypothetical protein